MKFLPSHRKASVFSITSCIFVAAGCLSTQGAGVHPFEIKDGFESYSLGHKPYGTILSIPDVEPPLAPAPVWTTIIGGGGNKRHVSILDAEVASRIGQVIAFDTLEESGTAYAFTDLTIPAEMNWTQSFDFYVDSLAISPQSSFMISSAYSADFGNNVANRLFSFGVRHTSAEGMQAVIEIANAGVGNTLATEAISSLVTGKWYTLTISANNDSQQISFSLFDGESTINSGPWYYRVDTHQVNRLALGQMNGVGNGMIYVDNFEVKAIPEPGAAFLLIPTIGLFCLFAKKVKA